MGRKELHVLYCMSGGLVTDYNKCVTAQMKFLWDSAEQFITV